MSSPTFSQRHWVFYAAHIITNVVMILWPWVFVGVVWLHQDVGGLRATSTVSRLVLHHPHAVDFFVTVFSIFISAVMTYILSTAVLSAHSDWFSSQNAILPGFVKYLRTPPQDWPFDTVWPVVRRGGKGLSLVFVLLLFSFTFTFVGPGLNAILIPHEFTRTAPLQGAELNFSSTAADCLGWISSHPIPDRCSWRVYNNFSFSDCLGENQLIDILDSGRNNMHSLLPNNNETHAFPRLGGMRFLGPILGVFPIGPNGIPAFNALEPIPKNTYETSISYNYSLDLQGLVSGVRCQYDTSTPITAFTIPAPLSMPGFNASCPVGQTVSNVVAYPIPNGLNNTLGAWGCKTSGDAYTIYFRGDGNYLNAVGNMSCVISPIQNGVFHVEYSTKGDIFVVSSQPSNTSNIPAPLMERSVYAIINTAGVAQGFQANLMVESLIAYGVSNYNLGTGGTYTKNDAYLRLFEALIQGMLQYESTYTRMMYSSYDLPPASCKCATTGQLKYLVIGWAADGTTAAYLIPLTIINLSSLILLVIATFKQRSNVQTLPEDDIEEVKGDVIGEAEGATVSATVDAIKGAIL